MHESLLRFCEIKSTWYLLVRGSRDKLIMSWVVVFNVYFQFSKPINHLLANSYGVTDWCISFVIVAYPFLFIDTLIFPIILYTIRYWDNPIETLIIALPKSWMAMSYWINVTGGAQGVLLLTWLINMRFNTLLLCSYFIEYILRICFDGSQYCSYETVMGQHVSILSSMGY